MTALIQGGNAPLPAGSISLTVSFAAPPQGFEVDVSAYVLGADGRVRGDADMIFFNQPALPDGSLTLRDRTLTAQLDRLAPDIERIALCIVADGGALSRLGRVEASVAGGPSYVHDLSAAAEAALIVVELYRRQGAWKLRAVGQGFNGGLAPLSRHFGVEVEDAGPPSPPPVPSPALSAAPPLPPPAVDLRKQAREARLVSLEKAEPKLVSLAKTAAVSLAKHKADDAVARVWLVLDVSGSMRPLFKSGAVDRLVQRALAYGLNLDDDGDIGVILFDNGATHFGSVDAGSYRGFTQTVMARRDIWGTTNYGRAIELLRRQARTAPDFGRVPVYVIFVTDGGTEDRAFAERQLREAASEGIFWKFMAIGPMPKASAKPRRALPRGFDFLAYLDDMDGRTVDNADFFAVADPDAPSDTEFFDLMAEEFATWLAAAREKGVLHAP